MATQNRPTPKYILIARPAAVFAEDVTDAYVKFEVRSQLLGLPGSKLSGRLLRLLCGRGYSAVLQLLLSDYDRFITFSSLGQALRCVRGSFLSCRCRLNLLSGLPPSLPRRPGYCGCVHLAVLSEELASSRGWSLFTFAFSSTAGAQRECSRWHSHNPTLHWNAR